MPIPSLTLKLALPDDCWVLTATAISGDVSWQGRAWIQPDLLVRFADALGRYPITAEQPAELLAGAVRDGNLLEAGHDFVRIAIRPVTSKGLLLAKIGLGVIHQDPADSARHADAWDQVRSSMRTGASRYFPYYQAAGVAFPVEYQAIVEFAAALRGLESGATEEATLRAAFL